MELIKAALPIDYTLIVCSDLHVGSPNVSESVLKELVDRVATDSSTYLVCNGDAIESITAGDKRFVHSDTPYKTPHMQADRVVELFWPIRDRILAWGMGNHEYKLINTADFGKYIADALGVPYGFYCYKLICTDYSGNLMHKFFMSHGSGQLMSNAKDTLQRIANKRAALKNKMVKSGHGDCIAMFQGHTHQLFTVEPTIENLLYLTDDGVGIHQHYHVPTDQTAHFIPPDSRWYGSTGSFMKLYSTPGSGYVSYAEVAGYEPSEIGWLEVDVEGRNVCNVRKIVP